MENLIRNCADCGDMILYKTTSARNQAERNDSTCKSCRNKKISNGRKLRGPFQKTCTICGNIHVFSNHAKFNNSKTEYKCKNCAVKIRHTGKIVSKETRDKISQSHIGLAASEETRKKRSINASGKNNPAYGRTGSKHPMFGKSGVLSPTYGKPAWNNGKHMSDETIKKCRVSAIKRLMLDTDGKMLPSQNPLACKIIEQYGKENGYNFQHAENGGEFYIKELGYWVDGYDKEKNVVIEYYEKYHKYHTDKDIRRIDEIKTLLNCKVIIIREWDSEIEILN